MRIDYAINLIEKNYLKQFSISALSEEAGFSSQQSFFRAFKVKTGTTPGKYYRELCKP
jgi:AraC-like DNA-binding protein